MLAVAVVDAFRFVLASNSNIVSRGFPGVLLSPEKMKEKISGL